MANPLISNNAAIQASLVGTPNGRIANLLCDYSSSTLIQASVTPLNKWQIASKNASLYYVLLTFDLSTLQLQNFVSKSLLFSFRPFYNGDDFDSSLTIETLSRSIVVTNRTTRQSVYIGSDSTIFQNFFSGAAWNGRVPNCLAVQGSVPFTASQNDTLEIISLTFDNGAGAIECGRLELQLTEFDCEPWKDTSTMSLITA